MTRARDLADWGDQAVNAESAWTTYTPTFTNLTVGNSTVAARYKQIGKIVFVSMKFTRGSTGSIGTTPTMSLPVTNATNGIFNGTTYYEDTGTQGFLGYLLIGTNPSEVYFGCQNVSGTYQTTAYISATVPFTWTTNDNINIQFYYEAA
jgi:hypothetical protein